MLRISFSAVATSWSRGTLWSVTGPSTSSVAHSSGRAAFLAPEIVTSPFRRRPPRIRSLSIGVLWLGKSGADLGLDAASASRFAGARSDIRKGAARHPRRGRRAGSVGMAGDSAAGGALAGPFGRRQRLHGQGMDLRLHAVAERRVDALVAAHADQAFELRRDDRGEEMAAIALDLEVIAGES